MEGLPRTFNGKIDRRSLPAFASQQIERKSVLRAPETMIEEVLIGIWEKVLGLGDVSIDDNFFEIGGHSLLATQVISRARDAFQIEMPLQAIFDCPTVERLASWIEESLSREQGLEAVHTPLKAKEDGLPLSFPQQRMWFLNRPDRAGAVDKRDHPAASGLANQL
jgi:acyl carrier protein